jgi:type I restriction enzyme, S subunit
VKSPAYPRHKPSGVEWLGDVPEHWEVRRFSREVRIAEGQVDPEVEPYASMLLVAPNHLESGTGRLLARETSAEQGAMSGKYLCRKGEVVYSKIRPALAKAARAPEDCLCSADMYPMMPTGRLSSRFLLLLLLSSPFTAWSVLEADRVAMPKINRETLNGLRLPIPPPREQEAIADFLDRETAKIDTLVGKKHTLIERLKEKRTALISRTVTRGLPPDAARAAGLNPHPNLKPSAIAWLGDVPEHWSVAQLRRFTKFITSGSRGWAEHYADNGSIFVRIGNLTRDSIRIDLSDVQYVDPPDGSEGERTRITPGDVLFSITAYLGSVGVADESVLGAYINQHIALVRLDSDSLAPRFAAYAVLGDAGQAQLSGQGYGGTKIQLALDDVKSLWLPVPSPSEQRAIVDFLDRETATIDQMVTKIEAVIDRLQEYRTALITAAVTGKIDASTLPVGSHNGNITT